MIIWNNKVKISQFEYNQIKSRITITQDYSIPDLDLGTEFWAECVAVKCTFRCEHCFFFAMQTTKEYFTVQ